MAADAINPLGISRAVFRNLGEHIIDVKWVSDQDGSVCESSREVMVDWIANRGGVAYVLGPAVGGGTVVAAIHLEPGEQGGMEQLAGLGPRHGGDRAGIEE